MKKSFLFIFILFSVGFLFILPCGSRDNKAPHVNAAQIKDYTINPVTAEYLVKAIDKSEEDNAECLIIELDTPGGLLSSTRKIVKAILSSDIPVVVYVYPEGSRAGSAGVFITYASHIAVMSPSTNIGAAHPVGLGGGLFKKAKKELEDSKETEEKKDSLPESVLEEKAVNDSVAYIRSLAEKRSRNIKWAEKSIRESASITSDEALNLNVIDLIAVSRQDLLNQIDGMQVMINDEEVILNTKSAKIVNIEMNTREKVLNIFAHPNVVYILMMIGFWGLLYEITHPGLGVPGVGGFICLVLAFYGMQMMPTNYAGLIFIGMGIILFIAEVNIPGFGLPALGGLICFVLGSLMLFESGYRIAGISYSLIIAFGLATAAITIFLISAVIKTHRAQVATGREGLIGDKAEALTKITKGKKGKVFVHGEIWHAASGDDIKKGDAVIVTKVDGMNLTVKKQNKEGVNG